MLPSESEELLRAFAVGHGEKPFRGSQVARHLWQSPVDSFAAMSDVPVALRNLLDAHFSMPRLTLAMRQTSNDGTEKFLFRLEDGEIRYKTVLHSYGDGLDAELLKKLVRSNGMAMETYLPGIGSVITGTPALPALERRTPE